MTELAQVTQFNVKVFVFLRLRKAILIFFTPFVKFRLKSLDNEFLIGYREKSFIERLGKF